MRRQGKQTANNLKDMKINKDRQPWLRDIIIAYGIMSMCSNINHQLSHLVLPLHPLLPFLFSLPLCATTLSPECPWLQPGNTHTHVSRWASPAITLCHHYIN